jgi:predicted Zn-dependent protease
MGKLGLRLGVLLVGFLFLWLGLSQFDFVKIFKLKEAKETTEEKLAKLLMDIYTNNDEIADDSTVMIITKIKDRICRNNGIDSSTIKIHVIIKDEINAFALPDGNIMVYSGLIQECKNAEEIAGVMAHELAHIDENHIMKKLAREFGATILSSISGGKAAEIAKMITSTGYSRRLESEADEFAVQYLLKAQIDPNPMADFMFRLANMASDIPKYMSWMSTHPESEERAKAILTLLKEQDIQFNPVLEESDWLYLQTVHQAEF